MKELKEELERIVRAIRLNGWENGKQQVKTPYDFTLADDTFLEEQFNNILTLFADYIKGKEEKIKWRAYTDIQPDLYEVRSSKLAKDIINILIGSGK